MALPICWLVFYSKTVVRTLFSFSPYHTRHQIEIANAKWFIVFRFDSFQSVIDLNCALKFPPTEKWINACASIIDLVQSNNVWISLYGCQSVCKVCQTTSGKCLVFFSSHSFHLASTQYRDTLCLRQLAASGWRNERERKQNNLTRDK